MFHKTSSILLGGVRRSLFFWLFGIVFLGLHSTASLADKSAARSLHNIGLLDQVLARAKPGQDAVNIDDQLFKVETLVGYRALLTGDLRPSSSFSMVARWPGGIVPYVYDETMNSSTLRAAFESACREWEQHANVRFIPRTSEPNYLKIRSSDTNSSYVGDDWRRSGNQHLQLELQVHYLPRTGSRSGRDSRTVPLRPRQLRYHSVG
jgi:hypothetical protein